MNYLSDENLNCIGSGYFSLIIGALKQLRDETLHVRPHEQLKPTPQEIAHRIVQNADSNTAVTLTYNWLLALEESIATALANERANH
jgi:hypothetical protein